MGSLAVLTSHPTTSHNASDMIPPATARALDVFNESDYVSEVLLQHPHTVSEIGLERALRVKAEQLGIPASPHSLGTSESDMPSSRHGRNTSLGSTSTDTTDTALTTLPSLPSLPSIQLAELSLPPSPKASSRCLTFSQYDKYLAQVEPHLDQPKLLEQSNPAANVVPGVLSSASKKSVTILKNGLRAKVRWKKRPPISTNNTISCICCRDDFSRQSELQTLPCGHTYCCDCLRIMINQASHEESKMPPRCCTQPIPGAMIKSLLVREDQELFLKAVQQYSTPWEQRIFCPSQTCGEFIPPRPKVDPKHPFDVICRECRTRVCTMCKMRAHPLGQDCPCDNDLDQVLKIGEKSGWRRCYKCRTLVELTQGCTHITCRCKAQFCYICGAIWDPDIGCPNICNGEEELERRRIEEAQREAEVEAEKIREEEEAAAAELKRQEAERRTEASEEFKELKEAQWAEMQRFLRYERKLKWIMWMRHMQRKSVLNEKYHDQSEKMRERHAKTEQHLEERQIAAEIALCETLDQAEKSVRIRVKHMEAYCRALGRTSSIDASMPPRVVTERDLIELGQQHNALEGMAKLHKARINVLRDKQTKRMEELLERQEKEMQRLDEKHEEDMENLAAAFTNEEDALMQVFDARRDRLVRRWELAVHILKAEMEAAKDEEYAPIPTPEWPGDEQVMFGATGWYIPGSGQRVKLALEDSSADPDESYWDEGPRHTTHDSERDSSVDHEGHFNRDQNTMETIHDNDNDESSLSDLDGVLDYNLISQFTDYDSDEDLYDPERPIQQYQIATT